MKRLKQIFVVMFLLLSILSCKKEDKKNEETLKGETISAKWLVSGSNNVYESFEFNESGNYIVVKNATTQSTENKIIFFGTYQIIDNITIELSDFGTIKISSIDNDNISFSITLQDDLNTKITINASKASEFESSTRTDLLCRTWKLISIDGENVEGTEDELTVLFSKAGTYLVTWFDGESDLAQWKWNGNNGLMLCYSWNGEPTCNGEGDEEGQVQLLELNENLLKFEEVVDGVNELYVLEPTSSTKSAKIESFKAREKRSVKQGMFK